MASRQCWCWSCCIDQNYLWRYTLHLWALTLSIYNLPLDVFDYKCIKLPTNHRNGINFKPSRVILLWLRSIAWVWLVFVTVVSTFYHKSVVYFDCWVTPRIWNILTPETPKHVNQEHTETNFNWLGCFNFWSETPNNGSPFASWDAYISLSTWKVNEGSMSNMYVTENIYNEPVLEKKES